jgi:hypothetical protein
MQIERGAGAVSWVELDASTSRETAIAAAKTALDLTAA